MANSKIISILRYTKIISIPGYGSIPGSILPGITSYRVWYTKILRPSINTDEGWLLRFLLPENLTVGEVGFYKN